MSDAYRTIRKSTSAEFKDRGSKFIAYLFPVEEEAHFAAKMNSLKAEHIKSRHHCPAYRLRNGITRSSDDGEPSGSAGKPILNQLLSADLVDVGCIVVRYFGGTKLGVSGLINAYKVATRAAIEKAEIITRYETLSLRVKFEYGIMGNLMNVIKQLDLNLSEKYLDADPSLLLKINKSEVSTVIAQIKAKMLSRSLSDIEEDTTVPGLKFILPY